METLTTTLPRECSEQIFSFLTLRDVLSYAEISSTSLHQVIPEVRDRRQALKEPFAYYRDWKKNRSQNQIIGLWRDCHHEPVGQWITMPTVKERVHELHKRLPRTHPIADLVGELCRELEEDVDEDDGDDDSMQTGSASFETLLKQLENAMRAHKLHAAILRAAMSDDPLVEDNQAHTNPTEQERSTTLERYIGDVLCITYLINQSNLRLIEGGPTTASFLRDIRQRSSDNSCYRSWVYMHSSILRVKHFTAAERQRLGIPEFCAASEMIPNDCYVNEFFMSSEMTLVFNEFGPLGPTFRQRDVVRLREIPASRLFAFFATNENHLRGETSQGAFEWLCLAHEESRKARPMSVRAPVVRLWSSHTPGLAH